MSSTGQIDPATRSYLSSSLKRLPLVLLGTGFALVLSLFPGVSAAALLVLALTAFVSPSVKGMLSKKVQTANNVTKVTLPILALVALIGGIAGSSGVIVAGVVGYIALEALRHLFVGITTKGAMRITELAVATIYAGLAFIALLSTVYGAVLLLVIFELFVVFIALITSALGLLALKLLDKADNTNKVTIIKGEVIDN